MDYSPSGPEIGRLFGLTIVNFHYFGHPQGRDLVLVIAGVLIVGYERKQNCFVSKCLL